MRSFLVKLLLYVLPLALYALAAGGTPLLTGEFTPVAEVAAAQAANQQPIVYGRAYHDDFAAFKLLSTQLRRPTILVLGSSRTMQLRAELFATGTSFYNAGGGANSIFDLRTFLAALPDDGLPRLLVVGLDQDWFQPDRVDDLLQGRRPVTSFTPTPIDDRYLLNTGRTVVADWLTGRLDLGRLLAGRDPLTGAEAIGVSARMTGSGFRNDGSRQLGQEISDPLPVPARFADTLQRIASGGERFEHSAVVAPAALAELEAFLDECAARHVSVVAFSPPYAPAIYAAMQASGHYGYVTSLTAQLAQVFAARGLSYTDFSSGVLPGVSDEDYVDGFHGSEVVYTQLFVQLLETPGSPLAAYADEAALRARLAAPRGNPFEVFDQP